MNLAMRIRGRAMQRAGELLTAIETKPGKRTDLQPTAGGDRRSRSEAAKDAGFSERQMKTAIRVANVPKDQFVRTS
jgi:hypothetical protein